MARYALRVYRVTGPCVYFIGEINLGYRPKAVSLASSTTSGYDGVGIAVCSVSDEAEARREKAYTPISDCILLVPRLPQTPLS
jgi:hypothetical protein